MTGNFSGALNSYNRRHLNRWSADVPLGSYLLYVHRAESRVKSEVDYIIPTIPNRAPTIALPFSTVSCLS